MNESDANLFLSLVHCLSAKICGYIVELCFTVYLHILAPKQARVWSNPIVYPLFLLLSSSANLTHLIN